MKVLPLSFIWCVSFIVMAVTCVSLNLIFWLSLVVFSATCLYMTRNSKRLEKELDEIFGE